jgi:hypothetical protein
MAITTAQITGPNTAPVSTTSATIPLPDLSTILDVSSRTIARDYIKGTQSPIASEVLNFHNKHAVIVLDVALSGISGVTFSPSQFSLQPGTSLAVTVGFDPVQIDGLPEGTSALSCAMNLSTKTVIAAPTPATPPAPTQWTEERWVNANVNLVPISLILKLPPKTSQIDTIDYNATIPSNTVIRWTKTDTFDAGDYVINVTTDDGMRVYVDDQLLIDKWFEQRATNYSATKSLTAGQHKIEVLYFNTANTGIAKVTVTKATATTTVTPPPTTSAITNFIKNTFGISV